MFAAKETCICLTVKAFQKLNEYSLVDVKAAGTNSEVQKGRQVTNWLATTVLGKPGHLAWMKIAGILRIVRSLRALQAISPLSLHLPRGATANALTVTYITKAVNINGDLSSMVKGSAESQLPAAAKETVRVSHQS